eukprot:2639996-Amphidinium_carterae.1
MPTELLMFLKENDARHARLPSIRTLSRAPQKRSGSSGGVYKFSKKASPDHDGSRSKSLNLVVLRKANDLKVCNVKLAKPSMLGRSVDATPSPLATRCVCGLEKVRLEAQEHFAHCDTGANALASE